MTNKQLAHELERLSKRKYDFQPTLDQTLRCHEPRGMSGHDWTDKDAFDRLRAILALVPAILAALRTDDRTTEPSEDVVERAAKGIAFHEHRNSTDALRWPEGPGDYLRDRDGRSPFAWAYVERCRDLARAALATITPDRIRGEAFDWLAANKRMEVHYHAPTYCDDDDTAEEWRVTKVSGPINDREWDTVGRGETPLDAILDAIRALKAPSK